jgi:hypothetical protein
MRLAVPLSDNEKTPNGVDFIATIIAAKMDYYPIEFTAPDGSVIKRNYRDVKSVEILFEE